MLYLTLSLDVVLPSHKVPKEIAPVHEVHLIGQEIAQVLTLGRHAVMRLDVAHPTLVGIGVVHRIDARIEWCFTILFTTEVLA